MSFQDRIFGSSYAFLLGDTFGAPFEGNFIAQTLWKCIGKNSGMRRYTDDSEMSFAVLEQFIESGWNQDALANRFAIGYRWSRGFGTSTAQTLKAIRAGKDWRKARFFAHKDGSFGNGAAMRAPSIVWCEPLDLDLLLYQLDRCSEITHAHQEAMEGARIVALAVYSRLHGWELSTLQSHFKKTVKLKVFLKQLENAQLLLDLDSNPGEIRKIFGNRIRASQSVVTATFLGLRFCNQDFSKLLHFCRKIGGDVDTISAIAGSIWGAENGTKGLPHHLLEKAEGFCRMKRLLQALMSKL